MAKTRARTERCKRGGASWAFWRAGAASTSPEQLTTCEVMKIYIFSIWSDTTRFYVFYRATRAREMNWRRIVATAASMQCELLSRARQYNIVCNYNGASSCVKKPYVAACIRRWLAGPGVGVSSSVCVRAMRPRFRTRHAICSVRECICLHM